MNIRSFTPTDQDYAAIVAIDNANWTGETRTVEEWRHWDRTRDMQYRQQRVVLETGDGIIGFGSCGDRYWSFDPGKFFLKVSVRPAEQQRGYGSALYGHLMQEIDRWQPQTISITAFCREDLPHGVRFLQNRGFKKAMRFPRSGLDVQAFDPTPFAGRIERAQRAGIVMKSMACLMEESPDWLRRWYDLEIELEKDVPYHDEITPPTFETFQQQIKDNPGFYPEAVIVALDGDNWVGMSGLWLNRGNAHKLETGLTGVLRSHRRLGVATAMKVAAICFAQEKGVVEIETDNEENNPMFQLNMQLGFKPLPAILDFMKVMNSRS